MSTNQNLKLISLEKDFNNAAIALNIVFLATTLRALLIWDPFAVIDVALIGLMAYMVYFKSSKKALYAACAYWVLDWIILVWLDPTSSNLVGYIFKIVLTYFLFQGAISSYRVNRTPMIPFLGVDANSDLGKN